MTPPRAPRRSSARDDLGFVGKVLSDRAESHLEGHRRGRVRQVVRDTDKDLFDGWARSPATIRRREGLAYNEGEVGARSRCSMPLDVDLRTMHRTGSSWRTARCATSNRASTCGYARWITLNSNRRNRNEFLEEQEEQEASRAGPAKSGGHHVRPWVALRPAEPLSSSGASNTGPREMRSRSRDWSPAGTLLPPGR